MEDCRIVEVIFFMSLFDRVGVVTAALLGATLGLMAILPDTKPTLTLFVLCPPVFVAWALSKLLPGGDVSSRDILGGCILIVIANATLYGFLMKLWNSLPQRLRSPSSPR